MGFFLHLLGIPDLCAVTVSFPLVDDPSTSLLAWTTTPWTLPSNLALCVNPDYTYIKIEDQERQQKFILHENLLRTLYKDPKKAKYKKLGYYKGSEMKGWRYVPLFDYFVDKVRGSPTLPGAMRHSHYDTQYEAKAFRVLVDTYVTDADGTGIVHQAPAFGDDDHRVLLANGVIAAEEMPPCPIDDGGKFTEEVTDFVGQHVKVRKLFSPGFVNLLAHFRKAADKEIQKVLKAKGRLIVQSTINHQYPFCWRYIVFP